MTDIAWTSPSHLTPDWLVLHRSGDHALALRPDHGQFQAQILEQNHWVAVVLSHTATPQSVLNALFQYRKGFVGHIGHASGIVWNIRTQEVCIFRDPFGFTPWMLRFYGSDVNGISATTSPELQADLTAECGLNRSWFTRFLLEHDAAKHDDVFLNTGRILPGEFLCVSSGNFDTFIENLKNAEDIIPQPKHHLIRYCFWYDKTPKPLEGTQQELAQELREMISRAVRRIPDDNPCFTLSGGLDSTAILSSWCKAHSGTYDAVSLVSGRHQSCDESHELDILEKHFPIRLQRVLMDEFWPLSRLELYGKFRAYGPLVTPGIESILGAYEKIEQVSGPRTIITGYGGNFIVKVRQEALLRHLLKKRDFIRIAAELCSLSLPRMKYLVVRFLANIAHGEVRHFIRSLKRRYTSNIQQEFVHSWLNPTFCAQFPGIVVDPFYEMSHIRERMMIPVFWNWEMRVRCMDMIARLCSHRFYDPLFDTELYEFCARIPPQYFLCCGEYRPIYKAALEPLLPPEIIHHPKCQSYDMLMHDGLARYAHDEIIKIIRQNGFSEFFDSSKFEQVYAQYVQDAERDASEIDMNSIWLTLSTMIWNLSGQSHG